MCNKPKETHICSGVLSRHTNTVLLSEVFAQPLTVVQSVQVTRKQVCAGLCQLHSAGDNRNGVIREHAIHFRSS